ncbi:MAG: hypothetical protein WAL71_04475 [Terriglobales bacterium]|jgi:hypothetical protein
METTTLLEQLRKERDELSATISVLERRLHHPQASTNGATPTPKKHGKVWTAAEKAVLSRKLKAVWARRKAKAHK